MKILMAVGCALVSACAVFAEDIPAGHVYMTESDYYASGSRHSSSWNVKGNWSDGAWIEESSCLNVNTNYYVPTGLFLYPEKDGKGQEPGAWLGGPMVVAGGMYTQSSTGGSSNQPKFERGITFLDGSYFQGIWKHLGLVNTPVTILATRENPFNVRMSASANYDGVIDFPSSTFSGTVESGMRIYANASATRPTTVTLREGNFTDFLGQLTILNPMTTATLVPADGTFTFAGDVVVSNGATMRAAYDATSWGNCSTVVMNSLSVKDGAAFKFWQDAGEVRPKLEVANAFSYDSVSAFRVGNFDYADLDAATADADSDNRLTIAHLAKGESATCLEGAAPDLWLNANGTRLTADWQIRVSDDGNGGKNVEAVYPRTVIKMIKKNSYSKPETRAFTCPDPENYWSTGKIPDSETTGDIVGVAAMQAYSPLYLPNATLTYAGNVKGEIYENGDGDITIKELNLIDISTLYRYTGDAGHAIDTISGGTINLLGTQLNTMSIMVSHSRGFNFASSIVGTKTLVVQDRAVDTLNNRRGYASFSGDNTGFHGRLVFWNRCPLEDDSDTRCFCTYLGNAKSWGGAFTQDAETFSAITLKGSPMVYVTNDVVFAGENVRGMFVTNGVRFNVSAEKTLTLGNTITYAGEIAKLGDGTLEMSGTASILPGTDAANRIRVTAGAIKVSSATAVEGLDVSFAEGTKLVVDKDCGFVNTTAANPLTIADEKLPVEIAGFDERPEDDVEVTVLTLSTTAAAGIGTDQFAFTRTSACKVIKFEKRESGDNIEYVATVGGKKGSVLIVR